MLKMTAKSPMLKIIDTYCGAYAGWLESDIGTVVFGYILSGVDA